MRAVLDAWGGELEQNPKALRLAIAHAQTAGPEGLRRLQKTTAVFEGLMSGAFSNRRHPDALPLPVVRAIVGGLRRATQMRLLDDDTEGLEALMQEMLKWSLLFRSPAAGELRPRLCANPPFPDGLELEPDACGGESRRARLLRSAIEVGLRVPKYEDLSPLRIADGAGLPGEAFTELYADSDACYLEALDVLGDELLRLVASPDLVSAEWPAAVCGAMARLLDYLASSPARLVTLTAKALEAGPAAIANVGDLAYEVATLLTEGASRRPRTRVAVEGIAGALWHVLYCEVLAGRGHRLPVLSEYISYVILTPYIGPDAAVETIALSRTAGGPNKTLPRAPEAIAPSAAAGQRPGQTPSRTPAASNRATAGGRTTTTKKTKKKTTKNGANPAGEREGEDYRRLAERRPARYVNTTPTSTERTITTIKGA
jgi:AcrR family transcriptional regulator